MIMRRFVSFIRNGVGLCDLAPKTKPDTKNTQKFEYEVCSGDDVILKFTLHVYYKDLISLEMSMNGISFML